MILSITKSDGKERKWKWNWRSETWSTERPVSLLDKLILVKEVLRINERLSTPEVDGAAEMLREIIIKLKQLE